MLLLLMWLVVVVVVVVDYYVDVDDYLFAYSRDEEIKYDKMQEKRIQIMQNKEHAYMHDC